MIKGTCGLGGPWPLSLGRADVSLGWCGDTRDGSLVKFEEEIPRVLSRTCALPDSVESKSGMSHPRAHTMSQALK